ncbi:MAG TPA: aminotransferase class IV [Dongiaceae bacterium]|nr:aminotransferase class IV [Dongiaceae bacterium]
MQVLVNGRPLPEAEASIPIDDRGFLFGDALFESMRAYGGVVFRLDRHLERLAQGAAIAGFEAMPGAALLAREVATVLAVNELRDARVRLTMTRGRGRPGDYVGVAGPPNRVVQATAFTGPDPARQRDGVAVSVAARRAVPAASLDPSIKTTSRMVSVLARREAAAVGAFEAILLDLDDRVTEGTASNLFVVERGALVTPPVGGTALPGVTRAAVMEAAVEAGIAAGEAPITLGRLLGADEVFLTNSSWEVMPVVRVDAAVVGEGRPGPVSGRLLERYRALVRRECAGG